MEPRRQESISIRKPKDLIDTRKRRRDSVQPAARSPRSPALEPLLNAPRPKVDLGAMLRPTNIPKDTYHNIQKTLYKQDKIITERGREIEARSYHIHGLKSDLKEANATIDRDRERFNRKADEVAGLQKQLREAQSSYKSALKTVNRQKQTAELTNCTQEDSFHQDLFVAGKKFLAEKSAQVERLADECNGLHYTVGERDAAIAALNDQIIRISMASGDELVYMAIQAQAQRTLGVVQGLQNDVAERDSVIENYRAKEIAFSAANDNFKTENEELSSKLVQSEKVAERAKERAAEAKAITEQQATFVQRVMEENKRLITHCETMK